MPEIEFAAHFQVEALFGHRDLPAAALVRHVETGWHMLVEYDREQKQYRARSAVDVVRVWEPSAYQALDSFIYVAFIDNSGSGGFARTLIQEILPPMEELLDGLALAVEAAIRESALGSL